MLNKFMKKVGEKGSLMVEAMAMLGLIAMVTPILYKKASERTTELQDINTSSEMRSLIKAVDDYLKDNYTAIIQGDKVTRASKVEPTVDYADFKNATDQHKVIKIEHLEEYLPYGFLDKDGKVSDQKNFGDYKISVKKIAPAGAGRKRTLTGFVFAYPKQGTDFPVVRASRISSMIGSSGGYALSDDKAQGVQGVWEVENTDTALGVKAPKSTVIAASVQPIAASSAGDLEDVLYRVWKPDAKYNTMETMLHMGNQTIDAVNQIVVDAEGAVSDWHDDSGKDYDRALWLRESASGNAPGATIAGRIMAASEKFLVDTSGMYVSDASGNTMFSVEADTGNTVIEGKADIGGGGNVGAIGDAPKLNVWGNAFVNGVLKVLQLKGVKVDAGTLRAGTTDVDLDSNKDYTLFVDNTQLIVDKDGTGGDKFRIARTTGNTATAGNLYVQGTTNLGKDLTIGKLNTGVVDPTFVDTQANTKARIYADTGNIVSRGGLYVLPRIDGSSRNDNYILDQFVSNPAAYSGFYVREATTDGRLGYELAMNSHEGPYTGGSAYTIPREVFSIKKEEKETDPFTGNIINNSSGELYNFKVSQARFRVELGGTRRQLDVDYAGVSAVKSKTYPKGVMSTSVDKEGYGDGVGVFTVHNSTDANQFGAGGNIHQGGTLLQVVNWPKNWAHATGSFAANKPIIDSVRIGRALIEVADKEANDKSFASNATAGMNPVFRVSGGYNTETAENKGSVNIRKGVVQIQTNLTDDAEIYREENTSFDSRGFLQVDRMISNKKLHPDISLKMDTTGDGNTGSVKYDSYQVNPAYTSVMHDIKLTTRGGARLSDILPDFVNKGIYVVDSTYKEAGFDWEKDVKVNNGVVSGASAPCDQYECSTSPWLGFVPKPQCPPNYAKVITVTPAGWAMAQAGVPNNEKAGRKYSDDIDPHYWPLSPDFVPEDDPRFPMPLYFQKSTWLRTQVKPATDSSGKFQGWNVIMGFIYPYFWFKEYIRGEIGGVSVEWGLNRNITGDENTVIWNLFPVKRKELEGYATVYCYFDRLDSNYDKNYVDKYDQLHSYREGQKKDSGYEERLNDQSGYLKYDTAW